MKTLYIPLAALVGLGGALSAQTITDSSGSSSVNYFSESKGQADGGSSSSTTFALTATVGQHEPGKRNSATYYLSGGFIGTLDAVSAGAWITSASPTFHTPRSTNLIWLTGTRLNVGTPAVTISGKPASVIASSPTDVAVRLPMLPDPGWHSIALTNSLGTTSIERGVGVLPMLYTDGAAASNVSFDLVFKGTKNDFVIWALGFNSGPKIPIAPYLHGLTLNASFVKILPSFQITDASGEFRLPIPPVPFVFTIYCQSLFITTNPGYSPGSFSNRVSF